MTFNSVFGNNPVAPTSPQYEALSIAANTTLVWPVETVAGTPYVAAQIDVTATAVSLSLLMPSAIEGSTGIVSMIQNVGSNSFTLAGNTGTPIVVIAPAASYLISLTDNTTQAGTWEAILVGGTPSQVQASALADNETIFPTGTKLEVGVPTNTYTVNTNLLAANRGSLNIWNAAGPGTLTLDAIANLTPGWFCYVTNPSQYPLTIATTGGATINGAATLTLHPGNGTMIVCSAGGFNTIYLPTPPALQIGPFTDLGVTVGATSPAVLVTSASSPIGALIVVGIMDFNTSQVAPAVTDSAGNTYTQIKSVSPNGSASNGFCQLYMSYNSAALPAAGTVTFTDTANTTQPIIVSAGFADGVLTSSSPLDTSASASGSSALPSVSLVPTVSNDLVVGWAACASAASPLNQVNSWSTPLDGNQGPATNITFTNIGAGGGVGSPGFLILAAPVPVGSLIVVGVYDLYTSQTTPAVTDGAGNTYTQIASVSPDGSATNGFVQLYQCYNCLALTVGQHITFTNSANSGSIIIMACAYATGAASLHTPLDASATAHGSSGTASVSATPTVKNELVVGFVAAAGGYPLTQPAGWTTPPLAGSGSSTGAIGAYLISPTATSVTYNPTLRSSDPWGAIIATFTPASPAALLTLGGNLANANAISQTYNPTLTTSGVWAAIIASFKPDF